MSPHELLEGIACALPAVVGGTFPHYQGCILHTRVALEVCNYFGVDARPVACQVVAYNAQYRRHIEAGEALDIERWHREDGSHSVGIGWGAQPRPGGWPGHLVVVAGGWFADYTAGQMSRPEHGMPVPPVLIGPHDGGLVWRAEDLDTGAVIEYLTTIDTRYRQAPDWTDPRRRRIIAREVIRELRGLR